MSCPSSPGRVASSSSTTGITGGSVKLRNATSTRNGVGAYLFSGTFCSTNEREREHPVHTGESAAGGNARPSNVKLTIVSRCSE